jgi:hypothetical protein
MDPAQVFFKPAPLLFQSTKPIPVSEVVSKKVHIQSTKPISITSKDFNVSNLHLLQQIFSFELKFYVSFCENPDKVINDLLTKLQQKKIRYSLGTNGELLLNIIIEYIEYETSISFLQDTEHTILQFFKPHSLYNVTKSVRYLALDTFVTKVLGFTFSDEVRKSLLDQQVSLKIPGVDYSECYVEFKLEEIYKYISKNQFLFFGISCLGKSAERVQLSFNTEAGNNILHILLELLTANKVSIELVLNVIETIAINQEVDHAWLATVKDIIISNHNIGDYTQLHFVERALTAIDGQLSRT